MFGRNTFTSYDGEKVVIGNAMNYSEDEVMDVFTNDQITRMHDVFSTHPREKKSVAIRSGVKNALANPA